MKFQLNRLFLLPLVLTLGVSLSSAAKEGWKPAGQLIDDVRAGNAFALSDGRVVSVGMQGYDDAWPATTQFWSPKTKTWTAAASKPALPHLYMGAATRLDDGRILVTGFCKKRNCGGGSNAELYDPATDTWSKPKQMNEGRFFHSMVKLQDGRVLVLGGCTMNPCMAGTLHGEIFDPTTNRFTAGAPMNVHRVSFTATLLADGRVLVAGGYNPGGVLVDNETYDPAANTWTVNAPMKHRHVVHAAVLLQDGRVLVAGGDCKPTLPCAAADIFNPLTGRWRAVAPMSVPRSNLAAIRLQDGKVLISGGLSYFGTLWQNLQSCEAFDPVSGTFVSEEAMAKQRANFSMAMLPNGRVLAVGGDAWAEGENKTPGDAELYTP